MYVFSVLALSILKKKLVYVLIWVLFIIICHCIDFLFFSVFDLNSAHTQNKDGKCVFNFCKPSCPVRDINKSDNFLMTYALFSLFIFWNDCYCISIKCYTMTRICNNVDNERILAYTVTFRYKPFKLFNYLRSKINLLHLCLVSDIDD
jgi:hypothetical protein